ncbi:MAG: PAS domain S-box protein [Acidobacteriota bacterium]|nr:PAS domain S-box protein [Acidobacteriota bacterium]
MTDYQRVLERHGFDVLFRGHPDAIYVFDVAGNFVAGNDALSELTGYTRDELLTSNFLPLVAPESREQTQQLFLAACDGTPQRYTSVGVAKDGRRFHLDVTNLPLRDETGEVVAVLGMARDVTEFHQAVDELAVHSSISQVSSRVARVAGWSIDLDKGELRTSDELFALIGAAPTHAPSLDESMNFYDEPYRSRVTQALRRCQEEGTSVNLEVEVKTAQGQRLRAQLMAEAVRDDAGRVVRIDGVLQDVSAWAREREAFAEIEHRVADTIGQLAVPLYIIGRDWRLAFVNRAGCALVGMSEGDLIGYSITDVFTEQANHAFRGVSQRAMDLGEVGTTTAYLDRFQRWMEVTAYPIRDGVLLTATDVTSRIETQLEVDQAARRAEYLARMLSLAKDAMIIHDLRGGISYWNPAAQHLYGWSSDEVLSKNPTDFLYDDPAYANQAVAMVLRDEYWTGEIEQRTRSGGLVTVDARWQLVHDDGGEPVAIFEVNTDVTERNREIFTRARNQRMESLGTLAGGIAHDLNNIFTPIIMSLELLQGRETDATKRDVLNSIERSVHRGADMVRQVLHFARGVEGTRAAFDPIQVLREVKQFCQEVLPKNIVVVADDSPQLPFVVGDETQIMQVLVNLVTNARDAMPNGGRLTLRASLQHLDGKAVQPSLKTLNGEFVVFEVSDTGIGMDKETMSKIYEPFFTTKDVGHGTGLGLSTSRAIARSHGGVMDVDSLPGFGTRFDLYLPASANATISSPPELDRARVRGNVQQKRVLVVDDEEAILMLLQEVMRAEGFSFILARNGTEALDLVIERGEAVDLVITDLNMPKMDGLELVAKLRERRPDLSVIVMSGLATDATTAGRLEKSGAKFLAKPFTVSQLLNAVFDTMGRR